MSHVCVEDLPVFGFDKRSRSISYLDLKVSQVRNERVRATDRLLGSANLILREKFMSNHALWHHFFPPPFNPPQNTKDRKKKLQRRTPRKLSSSHQKPGSNTGEASISQFHLSNPNYPNSKHA